MTQGRYCIIGAGAAGMGALKTLTDEGIAVDCFEKDAEVGGHWHHDYEALHLITARDSSGFEGFPMPKSLPTYPSREQILDYMLAYADAFALREKITFNTAVEEITPQGMAGTEGWKVRLSNGETRDYDGVIVANGHLWKPRLPAIAADFTGKSLHSHDYTNVNDIEGKVLVVGFGNSGCDLAVDAAQARRDVTIAMRRGHLFQPKTLFGKPRSEIPWLATLPPEQQNMILNLLILVSNGPASEYPGLPEPETFNLDDQAPIVNDLLLYWIQHGRIAVASGLERIEGRTVTFSDGRQEDFDTILWATGFDVCMPFLDPAHLEWEAGVPLRTAATILPTTRENLYFVGLCGPRGPQWPLYNQQAHAIARMIRLARSEITDLAARFAATNTPETRIDLVRRHWQADYDQTMAQLGVLAAARPVSGDAAARA
ncbi:NAD(P)/FAD-dependent oxidoreductase [Pseudooceanicola sp. CBS1P-1]|uniref:Trimethylamine monooxygenase n=1 Tax=Pseudooceanicola albus TaxID=2692189 RepID=A0A6L7G183_9RHOB|nr:MULTISPECIES: NAD(P)/FAD-dependent oxidoreductase [Pseudooceanicola]MBT9383607.1 NAD(P)/FAD-dependent oxidoreductase [Pseudooceanicola endophyticus]MXN17462.1 SidA/IucD/PvdA family monooxygenase [Pseudooceanicola albus]